MTNASVRSSSSSKAELPCGGFAVPIREGYATDIYIVSSGELMSLYAANNIAKGIQKFAKRGKVRLGGIIGNGRNTENELEVLTEFATKINSKLIMYIPRDKVVNQAEVQRKTVIEWAPESNQADIYRTLAKKMDTNEDLRIPEPLSFEELEELVYKYGN